MPTYATHKQARFEYDILETLEAGIKLTGPEVKSVRSGQIKLAGAFVAVHNNTVLLTNAHISPYRFAVQDAAYEPTRSRTLLLHSKQRDYVRGKLEEAGLTVVPLSVYSKGRHIKIELGVARGKKKYDKRDSIKKRDVSRDIQRAMKHE